MLGKEILKLIFKLYVIVFKKRLITIYSFDFLDSYNFFYGENKGWIVCVWVLWRGGIGLCIWGYFIISL